MLGWVQPQSCKLCKPCVSDEDIWIGDCKEPEELELELSSMRVLARSVFTMLTTVG
jgi:hypothetical protein